MFWSSSIFCLKILFSARASSSCACSEAVLNCSVLARRWLGQLRTRGKLRVRRCLRSATDIDALQNEAIPQTQRF
jgi:hypothetical protein